MKKRKKKGYYSLSGLWRNDDGDFVEFTLEFNILETKLCTCVHKFVLYKHWLIDDK